MTKYVEWKQALLYFQAERQLLPLQPVSQDSTA